MGLYEDPTIVDDASDKSVIEQHLCSELPLQSVPGLQTPLELTCNLLDSNVDHFNMPVQACSANYIEVIETHRDALASECDNAVMTVFEKTLNDDAPACLRGCTQIKVSNLDSEGLCSEEKPQHEGDGEMTSGFTLGDDFPMHFIQQEQKDGKRNIFSSEGHVIAISEDKNYDAGSLPDTCNHLSDFRHSEMSWESEPTTDLPVGCDQKSEDVEIMRIADPLLDKGEALCGIKAGACKHISIPQGSEVPSDVLYTEIKRLNYQLHDQKYGMGCNSLSEERVRDFVDEENINDTCVLATQGHCRSLGSSHVAGSPHKVTLEQTIDKSDADHCVEDVAAVVEQNIDVVKEINVEMIKSILPIEGNTGNLKDSTTETTTDCSFEKPFPFSQESDLPNVVLISSNLSKGVLDLLAKDDNCSINSGSAVDNSGHTGNEGKDVAKVDSIPEVKCPYIVSFPSRRNNQRSKSGHKIKTERASRKCNKACVPHPGGGMKIILEAARKKRSCISKPARSSIWGLPGSIKQFFEQGNEFQVSEVMCHGLVKARVSHQSGKVNGNDISSSSLSLTQNPYASSTRLRLKIKLGKVDLGCSSVLVPEVVDGLASAPNMDKDALLRNGQIANNHSERAAITDKSDGDVKEPCVVPPEGVVVELRESANNKGMDPGTSPISEVINAIPEVQVGERHNEDLDTVLGSNKELTSPVNVTRRKTGKKNDKLSHIVEDGSESSPGANRAQHSKNNGCRKNSSVVACSGELFTSSIDVNALSNSSSSKELSMEPLLIAGDLLHGASTETFKVKSSVEIETACCQVVNGGLLESRGIENVLSSAKSPGCKLPKSLKSGKVSKAKSKASDLTSRKETAYTPRDKQRKPVNKSEVKGKVLSDQAVCEAKDHPETENGINGNCKLDDTGKINAGEDCVASLDMVPSVGLGEQQLSLHKAWVCCDDCHKWRRIPAALADQIEETNCTWTCKESEDKAFADCSIPQEKSNTEINAELGLSDASGGEDNHEDCTNYRELENRHAMVFQESTFTHIFTNEFLHRSRKHQTIDEIMVCNCKPPPVGQLGCGKKCLNRILNIECVQGTCPCGDLCSNQEFQKCSYARLKWFKCGKKGYGLKALEHISKGQFLIEYVGEVLDNFTYEDRQREYALKGHRHFYFMALDKHEVIDASAKGNLGRFINHSCDPNCLTEKWTVNGEMCIGLFALRDIKQDEEVTFDYNYVRVFGAAAKKCYCGSPQCRGYIGGDPLNSEVIVQGDSDNEFPEPVMLTEDGELEDGIPSTNCFDNIDRQTARHKLKDRNRLDKSMTAIGWDRTQQKESSVNDSSAISEPCLFKKTSRLKGSVKRAKVAEVNANRLPVPSVKLKKVMEGSSNGRFEAVQEKLNELLDGDGGISKRKDAPKGYLKLLLLTAASGERVGGEAIQSNRDLSMILDALLKTKSRAVLNDIINKNGLQMLHNIMKQYKRNFKKIPVLRKLLKVLEYLAASKILTSQHILGGPPCVGMESFRESMLSLTEHEDKQVHQIARSFRDRWIPRPYRKLGYINTDDSRVESERNLNPNRFSISQNHGREQDARPTEAIDCVQQSMLVTTSVDAGAQEGSSALSQDTCEINGTKKRKRKSRWDQPAETKPEDVPSGFSCPHQSQNAVLKSTDRALPNAGYSVSPDAVIGHLKEKFNSRLPVSYGMPMCAVQQHGIAHAEIAESWVTAPGIPFNPFPPLPPYPRDKKDRQPSNSPNAETINQSGQGRGQNTGGLAGCSWDDIVPSTTASNLENEDSSFEDNKHVSKRMRCSSYDLGKRYFRQHKWNNSKSLPWHRNTWGCHGNNSRTSMCSIGVGCAPHESKTTCYSEGATSRAEKG
ncbi:hypothetical protein L6164_016231 [Bauhinia variegata]|uniref:Uncharacterized protein n=1 Tax=Bauhinia variegata TaxID=167791 RepID=A0ACB9NQ60_BAUVA|nr:hypothetical protein L6164_016231 [Bauhinia variegata]